MRIREKMSWRKQYKGAKQRRQEAIARRRKIDLALKTSFESGNNCMVQWDRSQRLQTSQWAAQQQFPPYNLLSGLLRGHIFGSV